jgi:predicted alpha/beta hydrolase
VHKVEIHDAALSAVGPAAGGASTLRLDTHWSRILHHDFFSADSSDAARRGQSFDRAGGASAFAAERTRSSGRDRFGSAERVTLTARDGYRLAAMRYSTPGRTRAHLIVAGGIGIPQWFYRKFAEFAASDGYTTLTLDYRGVGLSAPSTLDGFKMDYFDWGRLDLAAAVDTMARPHVPLYIVGHSFGGHAFGMLPNHESVAAFYTFGTGAGWHGWMLPLERIKVLALWHVIYPVLVAWKGYLPWSLLGMGADVPLDLYRQWKRWCGYPNYFFGDPSMRHALKGFCEICAPMMSVNATDDRWAPPKSRDAFMPGYRNAVQQTLDIDPVRIGLRAIGHMGYFKPEAHALWEPVLAWFDALRKSRARSQQPAHDETQLQTPPTSTEDQRASLVRALFGADKGDTTLWR